MRSNTGRLFRAIYTWWFIAVVWGFLLAGVVGIILSPDTQLEGQVGGAAAAMAIVGWLAYVRRAGIEVDGRQVVVRRYSGVNTAVDWADVSGLELVSGNSSRNKGVYVAVVHADGRRLKTSGLCARSPDSPKAQQFLDDLAAMRPPV